MNAKVGILTTLNFGPFFSAVIERDDSGVHSRGIKSY